MYFGILIQLFFLLAINVLITAVVLDQLKINGLTKLRISGFGFGVDCECTADDDSECSSTDDSQLESNENKKFRLSINDLSEDIIEQIFNYLTQTETLSFMKVNKNMYNIGQRKLYKFIWISDTLCGSIDNKPNNLNGWPSIYSFMIEYTIIKQFQAFKLIHGYRLPLALIDLLVFEDTLNDDVLITRLESLAKTTKIDFVINPKFDQGKLKQGNQKVKLFNWDRSTPKKKSILSPRLTLMNFHNFENLTSFHFDELFISALLDINTLPVSITYIKIITRTEINPDIYIKKWKSNFIKLKTLEIDGNPFKIFNNMSNICNFMKLEKLTLIFSEIPDFASYNEISFHCVDLSTIRTLELGFSGYPKVKSSPDPIMKINEFLTELSESLQQLQSLSILTVSPKRVSTFGSTYSVLPDFDAFLCALSHNSLHTLHLSIDKKNITDYKQGIENQSKSLKYLVWIGDLNNSYDHIDNYNNQVQCLKNQIWDKYFRTSSIKKLLEISFETQVVVNCYKTTLQEIFDEDRDILPNIKVIVINGIHYAVNKRYDGQMIEVIPINGHC